MRKKTIQEELEELEKEKEEHIKKMEQKTGHNDDHVYDFDAEYETHDFEEAARNDYDIDDEDIDDISEADIEKMQSNLANRFYKLRKKISQTQHTTNINTSIENSSSNSKSNTGMGLFIFILIIPLLTLIGLLVGGIIMITNLGVIPLTQQANFVEVTSTIQTVELKHDEEGDTFARIKVVYIYNENEYTCNINDHSIKSLTDFPEIGEQITLKINPNDPNEAIFPDENLFGCIMCMIFGGVLTLFGLIGSITILKTMFKK